jgi:hypothetical protein
MDACTGGAAFLPADTEKENHCRGSCFDGASLLMSCGTKLLPLACKVFLRPRQHTAWRMHVSHDRRTSPALLPNVCARCMVVPASTLMLYTLMATRWWCVSNKRHQTQQQLRPHARH